MAHNKLSNITHLLIAQYLYENFPEWKEITELYLRYLDENVFNKVTEITDNIYPGTIDINLLDTAFDEFCHGLVNEEITDLSDTTKRLLISNSKRLQALKGTSSSFDYFVRYLANTKLYSSGDTYNFSDLNLQISEDESFLQLAPSFIIAPVSGTITAGATIESTVGNALVLDAHGHTTGATAYVTVTITSGFFTGVDIPVTITLLDLSTLAGTISEVRTDFANPFTYVYKVSQNQEALFPFLNTVHPAGMHYYVSAASSGANVSETFSVSITITPYSNYAHTNIGLDNLVKSSPYTSVMPRWWGLTRL